MPSSAGCVKAICATTSQDWSRKRRATTTPAESFSASCSARRVACSAGENPNSTPATRARLNVNAMLRQSISIARSGMLASNRRRSSQITNSPSAPAAIASITVSVTSCRTTRRRPAPSASRTAISRRRATPRPASSALTFVHVISRTSTGKIRAITGPAEALLVGARWRKVVAGDQRDDVGGRDRGPSTIVVCCAARAAIASTVGPV